MAAWVESLKSTPIETVTDASSSKLSEEGRDRKRVKYTNIYKYNHLLLHHNHLEAMNDLSFGYAELARSLFSNAFMAHITVHKNGWSL